MSYKAKLELVINTCILNSGDSESQLFHHLTMLRMKDKAVAFIVAKEINS